MAGSTKIARANARATNLAKKLADVGGVTYGGAAAQIGTVGAGAFVAGALDERVGDLAGQRPSVAAGAALAAVGVFTKSTLAVRLATGMLAPTAYELGREMFAADETP